MSFIPLKECSLQMQPRVLYQEHETAWIKNDYAGYEIAAFGFVATINIITEKQESIALSRAGPAGHMCVCLAAGLKKLLGLSNVCF